MKITERALLDNRWEHLLDRAYGKRVNPSLKIYVNLNEDVPIRLRMGNSSTLLPNITTMEHLAQLEYLLSDAPALSNSEQLTQLIRQEKVG